MFYNVTISIIAGKGGNGCISFRHEKRIHKGGPNGGNGGDGGSVYLIGYSKASILDFKSKRIFKAENGRDGTGSCKTGRKGDDLYIKIPYGTQVWKDGALISDTLNDEAILIAKGGKGGLGNKAFATPDLTAPYVSSNGKTGEEIEIELKLKYIADIGIVGMPNAGKSTFLSKISNAKVKIGDYDFSTIEPVLGTYMKSGTIIADLPGLIEGAHKNQGLGHKFLQHVERCKVLLHFIDSSANDPYGDMIKIRNEIMLYDKIHDSNISHKPYMLCLSKCDLCSDIEAVQRLFSENTILIRYENIEEIMNQILSAMQNIV